MTGKRERKPSKTRARSPEISEAERRKRRREIVRIERSARDHVQGLARRMNVWENDSFNKVRDINPNILDPRIADTFPPQVGPPMGEGFEPPMMPVMHMNRRDPEVIGGRRNVEQDFPPGFMDREARRNFEAVGRDSWYPREPQREDVREFWGRGSPQRFGNSDSWGRRSPMLNGERGRRLSRSPVRDPGRESWGPRPLSRDGDRGFWGRRSPIRSGVRDSWEDRPLRRDIEENSWQPRPLQRDAHPMERFNRREPRPEIRSRSRSRSGPPRPFINENLNRQFPENRFALGGRISPPHGRNIPPSAHLYREDPNLGPPDRAGPLQRNDMTAPRRPLPDLLAGQDRGATQSTSDAVTNVRQVVGSLNKYITSTETGSNDAGLSTAQMSRARELLEELLVTVSGKTPAGT